jgi:hypothetical protein
MEAIHVREMSVECPGEGAYLRTSAVGYPSPQCAAAAAPAATTPFEACPRHRCLPAQHTQQSKHTNLTRRSP